MRTKSKEVGSERKNERKKCKVRFSLINKNKVFQKSYIKVGERKLLRAGMVPARTWRVHGRDSPTERFKLRRQMAAAAGKKCTTSLSFFHGSIWP